MDPSLGYAMHPKEEDVRLTRPLHPQTTIQNLRQSNV